MSKIYGCPMCGRKYDEDEVVVDAYTDRNGVQTVTFSCPDCGENRPDEPIEED